MIELYVAVKNATIKETLCKKWWASQQRQIMKDYEALKYFDGMLRNVPVGSIPGRKAYVNPSERWTAIHIIVFDPGARCTAKVLP